MKLSFLILVLLGSAANAFAGTSFTIAVIPDTQYYVDHQHQRAAGFPFDASQLFLAQMRYVSSRLEGSGGDIAFVTSVGDNWQSRVVAKGPAPERTASFGLMPRVADFEAPLAREGYELIAGRVPFSVVPGNHDYDWTWSDGKQTRVGGLVNFNAVFGEQTTFFKDKPWYVGSHDGGGDSAQVFSAGGYRFLHIGLQYDASDASLAWARTMLERYRGLPTIITTHRFLETDVSRPTDGSAGYNSPQTVWEKLIREHDQIFLVLSGHFNAQAYRVDANRFGHPVHQILSDFQNRRQVVAKEVAVPGIGDGWMRLMKFDFSGAVPSIRVRTYSTHYQRFSTEIPEYAAWYKEHERPKSSDADYLRADDFSVSLPDFQARFGKAESGGTKFEVSFPEKVSAGPITGRLFLMISQKNEPEVRLQSTWFNSPEIVAVDVKQLKPGQTAVVDASMLGTPLPSLKELPAGDYYVQAVLSRYTEFKRADGRTVWAHMDQWEGQQFNKSPGNLYSSVSKLRIDPAGSDVHKLALTEVIPPLPTPTDTQWVQYVKIQSLLLTRFWGRPMYIGAVVLLPRDYAAETRRSYPVIYYQRGHFSLAAPFDFSVTAPKETEEVRRDREGMGFENGYEFHQAWQSDDFPRMLAISFLDPTPFSDWSGAVNSPNNGPYADALLTELIPYLEKRYRIIRDPNARVLTGKASGGRAALALQLRHPEFFSGAWVLYPWAFNFSRYFTMNIYEDENAYEVGAGELADWALNSSLPLRPERRLSRTNDGVPVASFRDLGRHDAVMVGVAGGDPIGADDSILGPVGEDGWPRRLFDRETGKIDRDVANYWREGDLAQYALKNWSRIGPQLQGKLHFYAGDRDTFERDRGVRHFEELLAGVRDPKFSGTFEYGHQRGGWQPFTNAQLVRIMAEHVTRQGP